MSVDWNVVSALGTCLGAIATFFACCVALWQTKYANRKSLKLNFYEGFLNVGGDFICVTVCNTGNRIVEIKELAIYLKYKKREVLFLQDVAFLPVILPQELGLEKTLDLNYPYSQFVKKIRQLVDSGYINKYAKIKFGVRDSVNKVYYVKTPERAYKYMNL